MSNLRLLASVAVLGLLLMAGSAFAQHRYRGGSYEGLYAQSRPAGVGIVHIPCLRLLLRDKEKRGRPLSEADFVFLRDMAPAIEMDGPDIEALVRQRGCRDPLTYQDYLKGR